MPNRLIILSLCAIAMQTSLAQDDAQTSLIDEPLDPNLIEAETIIEVPSPLLAKDDPQPRAIVSSLGLDPDRALRPVNIISINDYVIDPGTHGYSYHLAPGTYVVKAQPDSGSLVTSNASGPSYTVKAFRLNIPQNAKYLLGARITGNEETAWNLQLFQLQRQVAVPTSEKDS